MIENKHTQHDLVQMQSLPLKAKIAMTKERIKQWYEHWDGEVFVSFSGGKDSTVLKHIVDSMYSDVTSVYVDTGLEYPEIKSFVKDIQNGNYVCFNSDVIIMRPKKRFDEVIKEIGYPIISKQISHSINIAKRNPNGKVANNIVFSKSGSLFNAYKYRQLVNAPFDVSEKCCDIMKKEPMKRYQKETKKKSFIGTMADESKTRYSSWLKYGCNAFESKQPKSQPISFWKENDILQYLKEYNVPYSDVYGEIVDTGNNEENVLCECPVYTTTKEHRTGCMFCMFGCQLEKESRFVRMKKSHPKQYEYCMKPIEEGGLGLKFVIDWVNENCGTHIDYDDKQLKINEGEKL